MRLHDEYIAQDGRAFEYTLDVYRALGHWTIEGTVRKDGCILALPYHVATEPRLESNDLAKYANRWIGEFIEDRLGEGRRRTPYARSVPPPEAR